ncbi:MAG: AAA family ATPase [Treponema sp.]|jgi:ATP-dependent exoDNAse (exonuclease V) alpha subunit|nr:AAA family ATPase [Treponema sp.]
MATNITVRLPWHMNGWNGTVCKDPKANTYCSGRHSYPGEMIAEAKNEEYEVSFAGKHCGELDTPPPCSLSCNAFGSEAIRCWHKPPIWFEGIEGIWSDIPPYTVNIWPYEQMYGDEATSNTGPGRIYNYDARLEEARKYFSQLVPEKSILIYYANYSNPFSDEEAQRYIVVGIARLGRIGKELFYENVPEDIIVKYAGGFIWQRSLTSVYPEQGMRIPFEQYYDNQEVLENIAIEPDNPRAFKYATREISDDDLITLVERLIGVADYLLGQGDTTQNWQLRKHWLVDLLSDLWHNRGAYPGFPQVLSYLDRTDLAQKYLTESQNGNSINAYDAIKNELLVDPIMKRTIALKGKDKSSLLLDVLPRFNLSKEQMATLIEKDKAENGITAKASEIKNNPYLLCEQYIGNNRDDVISFYQIDNGVLPSPECGIESMTSVNSAERFRALCVDALRWDSTHSFTPGERVLNLVNHRVRKMRDWRQNVFSADYFEVDRDMLEEAITFRNNDNGKLFLYLNEVFEDERLIENTLRALAGRGDIELKQPVTTEKFKTLLFDSTSKLSSIPEYAEAIQKQSEVCAEVFRKGLCVISGAAGTGKTSLVSKIIEKIRQTEGVGVSIKLLAPTGKATERIREKTGQQATTIHSLLASGGWLNDNMTFKRIGGIKDKNVNTVIIDETSMVDLSLLASLFRAIHWNNVKRLILVGDPNQLPPIGRGKVFSDTIEWLKNEYPSNVGELKHNIRQMENRVHNRGTGIVDLAEVLIQEKQDTGEVSKSQREEIFQKIQEGDIVDKDLDIRFWKTADDLDELIRLELISDLGAKPDGSNLSECWVEACKLTNSHEKNPAFLQVLSPFRGDDHGTDRLNTILQSLLNNYWVERFTIDTITLSDKVIQFVNRPRSNPIYAHNLTTKKNERIEIYNGDMGFVYPHIFDDRRRLGYINTLKHFSVKFKGKEQYLVGYGKELGKTDKGRLINEEKPINNLELAYAISVHKSQGSEFGIVYLVLPKRRSTTLSMELLYTAVTRAQGKLVLFIQEDVSTMSSLTKIERSAVRRINSSVFRFSPLPEQLSYLPGYYEEYKVIATLEDYFVRSKSEALIANALHTTGLDFDYEKPLFAPDGTMYLPDFTLTFQGDKYYWEHWGLLDQSKYKAHTEQKIAWYGKYFPGRLIESFEGNDISTQIRDICQKYFHISL